VVLLSDGRRNAGAPLATTAEQFARLHCPAIAAPVGSGDPLPDLELTDLEVPPRAFVGEPVAVRGRLKAAGVAEPASAMVRLVAASTGQMLAEESVRVSAAPSAEEGAFSLMYLPDKPGLRRLLVKASLPIHETNLRNNEAAVSVEAIEARIRVLYVEDQARYEYRYLKNLLIREPTIISSCLLLSADPDFPQEGTEPIRGFPATLEDLDRYDAVILGDLDPQAGWAGAKGLENLAQWVAQKGGGLAWLVGARQGLQVWQDTPLGKLLPVRAAESVGGAPAGAQPFRLALTNEGRRSSLFHLDAKSASQLPADKVVEQLPAWQWAAPAGPPTPAAEVLAVHPQLRTSEGPVPILVTGRYGAGQTLYCGSDDIWRWRRFRDIEHWRSFWLQSVRWLAGPRKLGAYRSVVLEASPARVDAGQTVNFRLRVRDGQLAADLPERIGVTIRQNDGDGTESLWLQRTAGQAAYSGSVSLGRAGTYTAQAQVAGRLATAPFAVQLKEAETSDAPADPAALQQWVQAVKDAGGEGHTIPVDHLEQLAWLPLPQAVTRSQVVDIRLWDNWLALLLVSGLFLAEWAWRRARGLA